MSNLKVIWTKEAKEELKATYDFYKSLSVLGAINLKNEILNITKALVFAKSVHQDDIEQRFKKIKIRHYKLIYTLEEEQIVILRIFDISRIS